MGVHRTGTSKNPLSSLSRWHLFLPDAGQDYIELLTRNRTVLSPPCRHPFLLSLDTPLYRGTDSWRVACLGDRTSGWFDSSYLDRRMLVGLHRLIIKEVSPSPCRHPLLCQMLEGITSLKMMVSKDNLVSSSPRWLLFPIGTRLMVGLGVLVPAIGVRIPGPESVSSRQILRCLRGGRRWRWETPEGVSF